MHGLQRELPGHFAEDTLMSLLRIQNTCLPLGRNRPRYAFTVTELLVVMGIIVLLLGILLPALSAVRNTGLKTRTTATMTGFTNAASVFQQEHNRYPGLVPEATLAQNPLISGTQNAILHMMGGAVLEADDPELFNQLSGDGAWCLFEFDNSPRGRVLINQWLLGEGPRLGGRQYNPYFSPGDEELGVARGAEYSYPPCLGSADETSLPTLIDAFETPMIYLRAARSSGPLVGPVGDRPQFIVDLPTNQGTLLPYTQSTRLGGQGKSQTGEGGSLFNEANDPNRFLAQLLRNPGFGAADLPIEEGVARGQFAVISAGRDGIYFSESDGPSDETVPGSTLIENPQVIREYDDLVTTGGG